MLKFIETMFGLPTLASINHMFDKSTPTVNNQTNGAPFPPRDGTPRSVTWPSASPSADRAPSAGQAAPVAVSPSISATARPLVRDAPYVAR